MRRLKYVLLILPLLVTLHIAPISAQEATPEAALPVILEEGGTVIVEAEPAPNVPGEEEASSLAETLIAAVLASAFGTAPVTMFVVQLLKPLFIKVPARILTVIVALLLAALTSVAVFFGVGVQWNSLLDTIGQVGPTLVMFIGTLIGAPLYFEGARRANAPGLSYARSPRDSPTRAA